MKVTQEMWDAFQQRLGYSDEEMKLFRENPRNEDVISKGRELMKKSIVIEVVDAKGCMSGHKAGDRFVFDGSGNLLTKLCPSRICYGALGSIGGLMHAASELFYAGADPNEMRFKRAACTDMGLDCGGWGRIVMELKFEDRKS